ncbi:hypothetical protein BH09SUM1_BH09SUM1_26400 [soil metagenome]
MFRQVLKQWLWDCHDHIVRLLVINVVLFLLIASALVALLLTIAAAATTEAQTVAMMCVASAVILPILLTLWIAPLGHFAALASKERDPGFRVLLRGLIEHGGRTWRYLTICICAIAILFANMWFYSSGRAFGDGARFVGFALGGLCFWMILAVVASMIGGIPSLIRDRLTARAAIKRGFLILLRESGLIIQTLILLIVLSILGGMLRFAGILLFGMSGASMLINSVYDVLAAREKERAKAPASKAANWKDQEEIDRAAERERMDAVRYNRTIRDILRPWEM